MVWVFLVVVKTSGNIDAIHGVKRVFTCDYSN
jgi:hypothetical protein